METELYVGVLFSVFTVNIYARNTQRAIEIKKNRILVIDSN